MELAVYDGQPATLFWFHTGEVPPAGGVGALRSHFTTLREALSFVQADLPPDLQRTARVLVRGRWLGVENASLGATDPAPAAFGEDDAALLLGIAEALRAGHFGPS